MLLHIALQEGFHHDDVRMSVDGREVFARTGVTTRRQTGYADAVEVDVAHSPVVVEIALPNKKRVARTVPLVVDRQTYLGVSLTTEGELVWKIAHEPFGYL